MARIPISMDSRTKRLLLAQMRPQLMSAVPPLLEHKRPYRCIVARPRIGDVGVDLARRVHGDSSSRPGLELSQDGGNELGNGRMYVHGTLKRRVRHLGIHDIENAVDDLVAAAAEDGGPENLLCVGIDDDFDEALRLSLLDGARHPSHWPSSDQDALSKMPCLGLRHTGATERWIYIKGIGGKTVADAAAIAIEKVGRDDLEVIVGRMGESALAVAVAERPDAGHVRTQLVVDHDVAEFVGFDSGSVEAEIVRIGAPTDGQQHMRADDLSIA